MTKMYGSMAGVDLIHLAQSAEQDIVNNPDSADKFVMLPKGTLVALVNELKDCLNRKFFFELGRSLQLDESRGQVVANVPPKYLDEFNDGVGEREKIKNFATEQCNTCEYKVTSVDTMQGRVYIASDKNKG